MFGHMHYLKTKEIFTAYHAESINEVLSFELMASASATAWPHALDYASTRLRAKKAPIFGAVCTKNKISLGFC